MGRGHGASVRRRKQHGQAIRRQDGTDPPRSPREGRIMTAGGKLDGACRLALIKVRDRRAVHLA
jgi:hypothetical protein